MLKQYIEAGQITGTHGVRGEMRLHPWCDSPEFLAGFKRLYLNDKGDAALDITASRVHGNILLIKAEGIANIESAERFRGSTVYISRADAKLPDGAHFVQDIIGCEVVDADSGHKYGTVSDVSKTGANDVWQVTDSDRDYLLPVIPDVVIGVDIESGVVRIRPLKGIFDDED
jgi:16S rRNA processing protein RimM